MANHNAVPPEHTKWKPGQSGNPAGPKPGYKHLSTYIKEMMEDPNFEMFLQEAEGRPYKIIKGKPIEAIVKAALRKAAAGDPVSREWLAKYGYGLKIDAPPGDPIAAILAAYGIQIRGEDNDKQIAGPVQSPSEDES